MYITEKSKKPKRADGQISGLAGELFVAAELLKREIQTSITFGNSKAIDLLAYNPKTNKSFTIQVKALRKPNYFLIDKTKIKEDHSYVFVLLNAPGEHTRYFIVPGYDLVNSQEKFGKGFLVDKMPGFLLQEF